MSYYLIPLHRTNTISRTLHCNVFSRKSIIAAKDIKKGENLKKDIELKKLIDLIPKKAEAYKKELEDNKPEYSEYLDRLIGRIYEFAHMYALRVPAEEYYEELDYIGDILRQKAYKKYPCYTEDIDEANYWYSVEEVEMEE